MKYYMLFSPIFLLTSCATIMNGTTQKVGISTNPGAANVYLDQRFVGTSPLNVNMSRGSNHWVHIDLEGYESYDIEFRREVSGWVFGNIVFGGVIGLAVDAVSGGIYKLTPDQLRLEIANNGRAICKKQGESQILIVMKPDPSWQKIGQLELARS